MERILLSLFTLAVAMCGCSDSNDTPCRPDDNDTVPTVQLAAPSPALFQGSLTETSFMLQWSAVPHADYYRYRLDSEAEQTTRETFASLTGLKAGTSYTVAVQACSDDSAYGSSDWNQVTVTTTAAENPGPGNPDPGNPDPTPDNPTTGVEIPGYRLIWSDEFDTATLDLGKWLIEDNGDGGGNNELQYYDARGVSMGIEPTTGRKCLILTARKENYRGKSASSGRINTSRSFAFTHGRIDALIRLPQTANGLWPAFWLLGADFAQVGWPACGEIDILEMGHADGIRNGSQDRYLNGACHWGHYAGGGYPNYARHSEAPYSVQDGFHLFTLIWDEQAIKCYLDLNLHPDAEPYFAMNIDDRSNDSAPGNYFHHDFFIIFNLAVGGNFPGIWNIGQVTALNGGEAHMYVDYVRVYQPK